MDNQSMRFLFGDRELTLTAGDVLNAQAEIIVGPNDSELSGSAGLARRIRQAAGAQLAEQCEQLIREYGHIDEGMAVYTSAGQLPYRAVIHAVIPSRGHEDRQRVLEQALSRSLQLCELNDWQSVAFPDFADECDEAAIRTCAQSFFRAITHFWDARYESPLEKVLVYSEPERFRTFFDAFRADGLEADADVAAAPEPVNNAQEPVGEVSLSETDIEDLNDASIDDWFK